MYHIKTMETYCISCKKNTANKKFSVKRTKQNRLMLVSDFTICSKKNQVLLKIKKQVDYCTSLSNISLIGDILF